MADGSKHGGGGEGMARGRPQGERPAGSPMLFEAEQEVYVLTREAVREVDRLAVRDFGIPSIVLMENAAFHVADMALHLTRDEPSPRVLVVCGPGNNGGDGLAAARHLHNAGSLVEIVLAAGGAEPTTDDARTNLTTAERMGLPIARVESAEPAAAKMAMDAALSRLGPPDLVIDALLGTGLNRAVREPMPTLIDRINDLSKEGALVLAVDIPSGLDADTGEPLGAAVRADVTVSLVGLKAGFTRLGAQGYIGDVVVSDIGAPRELTLRLGTLLADHESHESPPVRPGHEPAAPPERRPDRG